MRKNCTIRHLENDRIDRRKWDECIIGSSSRLIYARAFYLDNMAPGWSALVGEDYEWVFVITHRRKYGIKYLYQPPFCQQLGLFAKPTVPIPYAAIVRWIKTHFKFWEINGNYLFDEKFIVPGIEAMRANNFILDLSKGYENIHANYQNDLLKNLKRGARYNLQYSDTNEYSLAIDLFIKHYSHRLSNTGSNDYKNFENVCVATLKNQNLLCRKVINSNNDILGMAIILIDGNRLYNLMNVTTPAGRRAKANHYLLDSIIKDYSGRDIIFDFEGSDVAGIKNFYENFGPENQAYLQLKYNNLPWPLSIFKR